METFQNVGYKMAAEKRPLGPAEKLTLRKALILGKKNICDRHRNYYYCSTGNDPQCNLSNKKVRTPKINPARPWPNPAMRSRSRFGEHQKKFNILKKHCLHSSQVKKK